MKEIADILRDLREDRDLNQTQVAEILGTSQQYYSRYENGEHEILLRVVLPLAEYYGVSVDYIVGRTDSRQNIEALNGEFIRGYSCREMLTAALALGMNQRIALKEFLDFLAFKK